VGWSLGELRSLIMHCKENGVGGCWLIKRACGVGCCRPGMVWRAAVCWMEVVMPLPGGVLSLRYVGRGGLVTMLVERWVIGRDQCFGQMCGLVE